jgi:endonuclease/exonuclease/phosphatase (EEP) superfamily protein YafD
VVFHVVTVATSIGSVEPIPPAARDAPHLRVLTANIRFSNPSKERLARQLLAVDADVVLLQETTDGWLDMLENVGFEDRYPYRVSRPRSDSRGMALYSRFPLNDVVVTNPDYSPTIAARIMVRGRPVSLVDVHTVGPTEGISKHRKSVSDLRALVRSRPEPRVVAGDFNATPYNRTMHLMADLGLDSAHERRGRGLAVTWPNGWQHISPPIRLDHVLVDSTIAVLDIRELRGVGSDHKPVLTDLAIL